MNLTELPKVWLSPGDLWGDGTYTEVAWDALPALPTTSFDVELSGVPEPGERTVVLDYESKSVRTKYLGWLGVLGLEAKELGLAIPDAFGSFMSKPRIHRRVATCTCCYLELSRDLFVVPQLPEHRFLRFMNDQQCCAFWFLALSPDGSHAVAVAGPGEVDYEDPPESVEDYVDCSTFRLCSNSFESFIQRFELENRIFYAEHQPRALTDDEARYRDAVRRAR